MIVKKLHQLIVLSILILAFALPAAMAAEPIKVGIIQGLSGAYEIYGKAEVTGFKMGLEYFTNGTNKIIGRDVEIIAEDTQIKPARGKMLLTKLYSDDKVDIAVGPTSSGVALACLPVAEEFKKILIVEPAVADSITGKHWNRYIFRTGRNSGQEAISNAVAVAKSGVSIATKNWEPRLSMRNMRIPRPPISRPQSRRSSAL